MACDAARAGAVVPSRRVAFLRRLLVLGGLLIGGWLLGCAGHSAHAEEIPAVRVVVNAPVLGQTVEITTERQVVRPVVERPPRDVERVTPDASPPRKAPDGVRKVAVVRSPRDGASEVRRPGRSVEAQTSVGHVRQQPVPIRAPERTSDPSVAGGLAMSGVTAGFPSVVLRVPVPPRVSLVSTGAVVRAVVRGVVDEPSFVPD